MKIFDTDQWEEIIDSLSKNRTRTFLTAFGIFWGVFILVLLMGGGKGLQSILGSNFAGFASNSGFMLSQNTSKPYKGFKKGRNWSIDLQDVLKVRMAVPEIELVTPIINNWGSNAVANNRSCNVSVMGIFPEYIKVDDPKIKAGRPLNEVDNMQRRKVCVVGKRVVEELFPELALTENPCGRYIQLDGIYYRIIGVSGKNNGGISIGGNAETTVYLPYYTMKQAYNRGDKVGVLTLTAKPGYKMSLVQKKVERVLKRAHMIHPDDTQAVLKVNTEEVFNMIDTLFAGVSILVWMIGLGTLMAGAIGVSNIMIVTVNERTAEIGIRRAIGATPNDILGMVLSESVVLTMVSGMAGITLAVMILQTMENLFQIDTPDAQFQISFWVALGALSLLAALGVLAGLVPAMRAMKIRPVDAMREE